MPTTEEVREHESKYGVTAMGAYLGDLRSPTRLGEFVVVAWTDHLKVIERVREDTLGSLVTASDAAVTLGISRQRVYQLVAEGRLPRRSPLVFTRDEVASLTPDTPVV